MNLELILYLEALMERKSPGTVRLEWVAGHSGDVGNDAADSLATEGCLHPWRPEKEGEWDVMKLEQHKITPNVHEDENTEIAMEVCSFLCHVLILLPNLMSFQFSAADLLSDEEIKELELSGGLF